VSAVLGSQRALDSLVEALEGELEIIGSVRVRRGGAILWEAIVDLGDADPKELESRLRSIDGVRSIEVREGPVRGLAVQPPGRVIESSGARSILMTSRAFRGFLLGMREFMGEEVGQTVSYYAGYYFGRDSAREVREALGPDVTFQAGLSIVRDLGHASSIEALRSPDGSRYRIEARDLFECDVLRGRRRGRTSHWFRGLLAGVLSVAEGGEWDVEEVECVNDGSDKCAFEARRRQPASDPQARRPGEDSTRAPLREARGSERAARAVGGPDGGLPRIRPIDRPEMTEPRMGGQRIKGGAPASVHGPQGGPPGSDGPDGRGVYSCWRPSCCRYRSRAPGRSTWSSRWPRRRRGP